MSYGEGTLVMSHQRDWQSPGLNPQPLAYQEWQPVHHEGFFDLI